MKEFLGTQAVNRCSSYTLTLQSLEMTDIFVSYYSCKILFTAIAILKI